LDDEHNRRGSADLVRSLGASWPDYHDEKQQRAADSIVAWRLGQMRFALAPYGLSVMQREDMNDALDDLEQVALRAPAPHTEREIHALRDEIGKATVLPFERASWSDFVPLFEAFLGLFTPEEKTRRAFEDARAALRAQIEVAFSVLGPESTA